MDSKTKQNGPNWPRKQLDLNAEISRIKELGF